MAEDYDDLSVVEDTGWDENTGVFDLPLRPPAPPPVIVRARAITRPLGSVHTRVVLDVTALNPAPEENAE